MAVEAAKSRRGRLVDAEEIARLPRGIDRVSQRDRRALPARIVGHPVFEIRCAAAADRRQSLGAGAEGPLENGAVGALDFGGNIAAVAQRRRGQAVRRALILVAHAATLTYRSIEESVQQLRFQDRSQRIRMAARRVSFRLSWMTARTRLRSHERRLCRDNDWNQQCGKNTHARDCTRFEIDRPRNSETCESASGIRFVLKQTPETFADSSFWWGVTTAGSARPLVDSR